MLPKKRLWNRPRLLKLQKRKKPHLLLQLSRKTNLPKANICELFKNFERSGKVDIDYLNQTCHQPDCQLCPLFQHAWRDMSVSRGRTLLKEELTKDEKLQQHLEDWMNQVPQLLSRTTKPEDVKRLAQTIVHSPFKRKKALHLEWMERRFEKLRDDLVEGCPVCYEPLHKSLISFECCHLLCFDCFCALVQSQHKRNHPFVRCPMCNKEVLYTPEALKAISPLEEDSEEEVLTQPYSPPPPEELLSLPSLMENFLIKPSFSPYFSAFEKEDKIQLFDLLLQHPFFNNRYNLKDQHFQDSFTDLDTLQALQKHCKVLLLQMLRDRCPFPYLAIFEFEALLKPLLVSFVGLGYFNDSIKELHIRMNREFPNFYAPLPLT